MKGKSYWDVLPLTLVLVVLVSGCPGSPDSKCTKNENCDTGYLCNSEGMCVKPECVGAVADCYESNSGICYVGSAPCLAGILGACTRSSSASNYFYRCGPACGPCNANTESCCDGSCIDTTSNPEHCGSCANNCKVANASGSTCSNSTCSYKCDSNYGNCDGDWTNGCEENLLSSATNCGACGATCKGHTGYSPTCNGGICSCEQLADCANTAIPWADVCIVGGLCECSRNSYIPCPIGQYCCKQGCCLSSCSDTVCSDACTQASGKVWCKSGCCDSCNPDTNCG